MPDVDVFEMPDGLGFQFRGFEAPVLVRGRLAGRVVTYLRSCLDGQTSVESVLREAPSDIPPAALVRSLLLLHSKGVLVPAEPEASEGGAAAMAPTVIDAETLDRQLLYWGRHLAITRSAGSAAEVTRRLALARVVVVGTGMFGVVTADLLARSGFHQQQVLAWNDDGMMERNLSNSPAGPTVFHRLTTTGVDQALDVLRDWCDAADLIVTATCDAPSALFRGINDVSLRARVPWLYGNADASAIDIGPLVQPYESACYACVEARRRSAEEFPIEHELYEDHLASERDARERVVMGEAVWPATLAASMLVGEACRFISGLSAATLVDTALRVLPISGTIETNRVSRVPRCPSCFRGEIPPADISTWSFAPVDAVG
ncbi:MAG TPA: TOMM precursor leader peptide-binding protein [Gemmatimonadaceae bacterium]|nr:TOMM precursor leader peptide-binding protein [Gemmatimonadaceae bacterium]